jgi:hypothetical protein
VAVLVAGQKGQEGGTAAGLSGAAEAEVHSASCQFVDAESRFRLCVLNFWNVVPPFPTIVPGGGGSAAARTPSPISRWTCLYLASPAWCTSHFVVV